jgi:hypothetical protein
LKLDDCQREQAVTIIDAAELEAAKPNANQAKITRLLKPMLKWTGERFTKAIDTALGAIVANAISPG